MNFVAKEMELSYKSIIIVFLNRVYNTLHNQSITTKESDIFSCKLGL